MYIYNKALRSYIYIYIYVIVCVFMLAGQTAGKTELAEILFRKLAKKINFFVQSRNFLFPRATPGTSASTSI